MKILGDKLGMKFDHSMLFIKYIKTYMLIDKNMNYKNYEIKEFKTEKLDELLKNEMSLKDFNIDIVKINPDVLKLYDTNYLLLGISVFKSMLSALKNSLICVRISLSMLYVSPLFKHNTIK